ncbi:MAG: AAA family ATPase [Armatimonadetes bacterium]|nr:AAA family ATPase [Armatimonadota bacterium]
MRVLETITVRNFKSIRDQTLRFAPLNVFIGGNGSGKSNLVGVFHFLNRVVNQELQTYVGVAGGADSVLHFGRKRSPSLFVGLEFASGTDANGYQFALLPTEEDSLIYGTESLSYHDRARYPHPLAHDLGSGHKEALLPQSPKRIARWVRSDLQSYRIYHFHDTSPSAGMKQTCDVDDNRMLHSDAGNLAAFLYQMQSTQQNHFDNIEDTVRQIAPFFERFQLEPSRLNKGKIRLEWKERGSDAYFNAHALSDGTLRFICLATLLLQPELPSVVLLDEPELGLHPAAITLLAALLESAVVRTQVLVATQSVTLVNQFTPDRIWVAERTEGESTFRHLAHEDLTAWLDGYALGDLWEKNILGGRP